MRTMAGLSVLILLTTTGCFQITVPAKPPPPAAEAADAAPAQPKEVASEESADTAPADREERTDLPRPARGSEGLSSAYQRCMNSGEAAQGVQIALAECTQGELARQDAKLNEVYQFVMDHNADEQRAEIRDAERAWIAHRDQKCVYDEGGGSNAALEQLTCKTNETIRRRQSLENRQ